MLLFALIANNEALAQFYNGSQMTFGKSRVQYDDRFWSFMRFEKFDTYFYLNGKPLAIYTARYADRTLRSMERKLDYELGDKIQFVIFNKLGDLKQSNIGLISEEQYNVGGVTHIVGSKIFLYFDGDHRNFEKQIRAGIAQVMVDEMMYGGRLTAMIRNSALMSLPEWYTSGLISYISEEWNTETDNFVRDGILRGDYRKFNALSGEDAVYAGHSIWKFIADKYGSSAITNIVYLTRVSRNVESGFMFVLGITFKTLVQEWMAYYSQLYSASDEGRQAFQSNALPFKHKKNTVYSNFVLSPDGNYAAWVSNQHGQIRVFLHDNEKSKTVKLLKQGHRLDEKTDYSFPLLAWHPTSKLLAIIFESKGKNYMWFYTTDDGKFEKKRLFNIEKVLDFSFAQNGRMIAMSAVSGGQSDIFVYSIAANTFEPVTRDIWDDRYPRFVNNSSAILFSSNRPGDTIRYDVVSNLEEKNDTTAVVPPTMDIFLYQYGKGSRVLRRVTNTAAANEIMPMEYSRRFYTYLSDENGINNRYLARLDSAVSYIDTVTHYRYFTTSFPVTDYSRSILSQDFPSASDKFGELIFSEGKYRFYIHEKILPSKIERTTPVNTFYMDQLIASIKADTAGKSETQNPRDTEKEKKKQGRRITNVLVDELDYPRDTSGIDINNYRFGSENKSKSDSAGGKKKFVIPRQQNYDVEYSINQLVSQVDFNFLNTSYQKFTGGGSPVFLNPGFNALFKVGIIDLMEDYRITGGFRLSVSLDNTEYFLAYENLRRRLDRSVIFHRQAMLAANDYSIIKLRSNSLYYVLKWPFSNVWALKGTGIVRYDKTIFASTDIQNLREPNIEEYWGGLKGELIFDNTRNKGLNLYYGWRWKVFGEYYQMIDEDFKNLVVLGMDFRHYQKIHRTFIWANRLAASTSFGNNRLIYYLGGVDNWLIPKFNNDINVSQTQNYAYQTLATNMRGFTQNIRNGNNFAVLNSELRFPVFRYFASKPIKSDFLNNFQIIGFGDLGTAWTGSNPFSEENTVFTRIIQNGPIRISLRDERDPIVGGFGMGLRTRLLGYFLRLDYAWGVENLVVQKPLIYLSLSLDF